MFPLSETEPSQLKLRLFGLLIVALNQCIDGSQDIGTVGFDISHEVPLGPGSEFIVKGLSKDAYFKGSVC